MGIHWNGRDQMILMNICNIYFYRAFKKLSYTRSAQLICGFLTRSLHDVTTQKERKKERRKERTKQEEGKKERKREKFRN